MHAVVRANTFDESRLGEARAEVARFMRLHAGQAGYAGSLTVDLGAGRQLVVNLWETEADASAGLEALGPEVRRVIEPLMAAPSQLVGTGPLEHTDLSLRDSRSDRVRRHSGRGSFQPEELAYLNEVRSLARLATVSRDGMPHVVPVGWSYNRQSGTIDVGGRDLATTRKYRDVAREGRAAIVIDEVLPTWSPRGIEVRGTAEAVEGPPALIRIHPDRVRSWGLSGRRPRSSNQAPAP